MAATGLEAPFYVSVLEDWSDPDETQREIVRRVDTALVRLAEAVRSGRRMLTFFNSEGSALSLRGAYATDIVCLIGKCEAMLNDVTLRSQMEAFRTAPAELDAYVARAEALVREVHEVLAFVANTFFLF